MRTPSLARATAIYARTGILTFGGGDPTTAALQREFVGAKGWLSPERYGLTYALARITPGTNILAFCAGTAWQMLGWAGAVAAVAATALPSAALVVLFSAGYDALKSNRVAQSAIAALLAATAGMMATAVWQLLEPHLLSRDWRKVLRGAAIFGCALALAFGLGMPPIPVLGLGALAGFFCQVPER